MTLNLTKGGAFEFDSSEARFSQVKPPSWHLLWAWWLITSKVQLAKNHHHHKLLPTTTQQQQLNVSSSSSRPGNPCDVAAGYFHRPTGGKSSEGGRRTKILIYISRFGQELQNATHIRDLSGGTFGFGGSANEKYTGDYWGLFDIQCQTLAER